MHALNEYVEFLWTQLQYDWSVLSNPWVLYPIVPALLYMLFFFFKWWVLLAPITIPCSILSRPKEHQAGSKEDAKDFKKELGRLLNRKK